MFFLLVSLHVFAQPTKVRGKILDAKSQQPVPFATVAFIKSSDGTITDINGEYYLETRKPTDSIFVNIVGYKPYRFLVNKSSFQTVDINLEPNEFSLNEVKVYAGVNPAYAMLAKIIKHKDENNPNKIDSYEYQVYNKMELDVNNIDSTFKKQKVFKHFQFIFNYMDTSAETGKSYLPVFINETLSDFYKKRRPDRSKEVIKATRNAGVKNQSITQYTGSMYLDINVYDNFISLFDKSFISPISSLGRIYYEYYLTDSAFIDSHWCYQMTFKPRSKTEPTFKGNMWVNDTTFALKRIRARISGDVNINYVKDVVLNQEFEKIDNKSWFLVKDELFADFNLKDSATGFFGKKTSLYKNIVLNKKYPEDFFDDKVPQKSITLDDAYDKDSTYWNGNRHEPLSKKEENIYQMVDSIKNVPVFRTFVDIVTLFVSGYHSTGKLEWGPYFSLYSFNAIEGARVRLGGRTTVKFSKNLRLNYFLAYGFKDEAFKYGLGFKYILNQSPRVSFGASYKDDFEQLGQSNSAFMGDNILKSVLMRKQNFQMTKIKDSKVFFEKEWFEGFSNTISLNHRSMYSNNYVPFITNVTNDIVVDSKNPNLNVDRISTAEVSLDTHLAYNEKFVKGPFERISFGSEYPVFDINVTAGLPNVMGSKFEYVKAKVRLKHHFDVNPFGWFSYTAEAGQTFGRVPYPLLNLPEGNETYALDDRAYNMLNYYEFISDQYASLYCEQHFDGFFLNKIPLIRMLKWREVVYGKGIIGTLSSQNKNPVYDLPIGLGGFSKEPYYEAGVGLENIFKIFRIDAVWRLSYLDKPGVDIQKFGLRAKIQIIF